MRKIFSLYLLLQYITCLAQDISVSGGAIDVYKNFPSEFVEARTVAVWLPENYSADKKYAVLYMHDGQMLFDSTITWNKQEWRIDETISTLINLQMIKDVIVVAIWNNGEKRYREYFPQKPFFMIDANERNRLMKLARENNRLMPEEGPLSDAYLKFIVAELNPFIDSSYSVHTDMKNTIIAGSSMGGLISLYALCEYPAVFGGAICMSTHWPGIFTANESIPNAFFNYLKSNLPDPSTHTLYFDLGTETLDSLYAPYQLQADAIMKEKKYTAENWLTKTFVGAEHTEIAWAERLVIPVMFLLGKD